MLGSSRGDEAQTEENTEPIATAAARNRRQINLASAPTAKLEPTPLFSWIFDILYTYPKGGSKAPDDSAGPCFSKVLHPKGDRVPRAWPLFRGERNYHFLATPRRSSQFQAAGSFNSASSA